MYGLGNAFNRTVCGFGYDKDVYASTTAFVVLISFWVGLMRGVEWACGLGCEVYSHYQYKSYELSHSPLQCLRCCRLFKNLCSTIGSVE